MSSREPLWKVSARLRAVRPQVEKAAQSLVVPLERHQTGPQFRRRRGEVVGRGLRVREERTPDEVVLPGVEPPQEHHWQSPLACFALPDRPGNGVHETLGVIVPAP